MLLSVSSRRNDRRDVLTQSVSARIGACVLTLLLPFIQSRAQRSSPPGYIGDNTDWWSCVVGNSQDLRIETQHRLPASSNHQILGITLGDSGGFPDVVAKLGKATITSRGDGAESRNQICYVSSGSAEKVHVIFEQSETIESFYLFSGGAGWTGSDRCVNSDLISKSVGTASGIHLGQSRKDVETILGEPSATRDDRLLYSFEGERTLSPEDYRRLHPHYTNLPNETLVWTIDVRIVARFENSGLIYLAVSRSEVN